MLVWIHSGRPIVVLVLELIAVIIWWNIWDIHSLSECLLCLMFHRVVRSCSVAITWDCCVMAAICHIVIHIRLIWGSLYFIFWILCLFLLLLVLLLVDTVWRVGNAHHVFALQNIVVDSCLVNLRMDCISVLLIECRHVEDFGRAFFVRRIGEIVSVLEQVLLHLVCLVLTVLVKHFCQYSMIIIIFWYSELDIYYRW